MRVKEFVDYYMLGVATTIVFLVCTVLVIITTHSTRVTDTTPKVVMVTNTGVQIYQVYDPITNKYYTFSECKTQNIR